MKITHKAIIEALALNVTPNENAKVVYANGVGNGKDAFGYGRGNGASAVCFMFALNAEYNDNAPIQRPSLDSLQLELIESKLWPGKTRAGTAPALASMNGRGYLIQASGGYTLSQKGLAAAHAMLAEMGMLKPAEVVETPAEVVETPAEVVETPRVRKKK